LKKDRKYIFILTALLIGFVLFQLFGPTPLNWNATYAPKDKNPFGAYLLSEGLSDIFPNVQINKYNLTFYELQDSIGGGHNVISISDQFNPDKEAAIVLLDKVAKGSHAFISAHSFSGIFRDTLHIDTKDELFQAGISLPKKGDTTFLNIAHQKYYYQSDNIISYFNSDSLNIRARVISTNETDQAVTIQIPWGEGYFLVNTTPLAFTNNYLIEKKNHHYISTSLSYLPVSNIWWTSYYQIGRLESNSPLRFILKTEALRWAYYLTMAGLLLFIFFEGKRKQRIIPIVKPIANTTLEFVATISNMYWHARDYKGIAEKKIAYFLDHVRTKYYLTTEVGDGFMGLLAKKSGLKTEEVTKLFSLINVIQSAKSISATMLLDLTKELEKYNYRK
jgi:hypothetical protein